jgi:hypothetical protein
MLLRTLSGSILAPAGADPPLRAAEEVARMRVVAGCRDRVFSGVMAVSWPLGGIASADAHAIPALQEEAAERIAGLVFAQA